MRYFSIISAILGCVAVPLLSSAKLVRGQVIDHVTKEPMAGVCLKFYPDSACCFTDSLGYFTFDGIGHTRIDIEAQFSGYDNALLSQILTTSSKDLVVTIELKEKIHGLDEVVVSARHPKMVTQNEMSVTGGRSFSVEECRRYAGGMDDPARMASNFAGCGTVGPGSNALVVRGNAPYSVSWKLEGIDIPSPVHFNGSGDIPGGGLYTIFSSFMLANSDFYSGCFPAEYYNAVGGIFDVKLRSGNPWKHEFSTQLGIQGFELSAEGPLSNANGPTFICNARLSTMQLLSKIISELSPRQTVGFHDYSAKLYFPNTKIGRISIWGILGRSKVDQVAADVPNEWISTDDRSDLSMYNMMFASGITNEYTLDTGGSMRNIVAVTRDCQHMNYGIRQLDRPEAPASDYEYDDKCTNLIVSSILNQRLSNRTIGRYGVTYKHIRDNCLMQFEEDAERPFCNYSSTAQLLQGHSQIRHGISTKITSILGGSVTYFSSSGEWVVEPRLGLEYKPRQNHSIALGLGLHSQIATLYIYMSNKSKASDNNKLKMMKSFHFSGSYSLTLSPVCRLKIEPYFQYLYDVPVLENSTFSIINLTTVPPSSIMRERFGGDGAGLNTGIDVTYERFMSKGYYYMASLSVFRSTYRDFFDNWHSTFFDTRWYFNILGGKEFTFRRKNGLEKVLGLNAHISMSGHNPYSPVDYEESHKNKTIIFDESLPFSYRKKGINILGDISLTYMVNYRHFTGTFALQVKNFFGNQYLGKIYNLPSDTIEELYFKSPIPLLSYKIEF